MKANTGSIIQKQDAYQRRKNAANFLQLYIESVLKNKNYIVLGDWNDRLDFTIYDGISASPFKGLIDADYFFPTKTLADKGRKTYFTGSVIDHIMVGDSLNKYYINESINVFDNANSYLSGFSNSTSDHYPVFASYKFFNQNTVQTDTTKSSLIELKPFSFDIYPNPSSGKMSIVNHLEVPIQLNIYNLTGQKMLSDSLSEKEVKSINTTELNNGLFLIKISNTNSQEIFEIKRLVIAK
jgi:hypothetical protein